MQSSLKSFTHPYEITSLYHGLQSLEFLPKVIMNIWDTYIQEDITIETAASDSKIELTFVLDGEAELLAIQEQNSTTFWIKPNTAAVLYMPNSKVSFSPMQKTKINMLGIELLPCQLKQMLGIDKEINIDKLICSNEFLELSISQKTILYQIFNSKKHSNLTKIIIISCAYILLKYERT